MMNSEDEAEIKRLQGLIAALGDPSTWEPRKNLKGNTALLQDYERRLRILREQCHQK